jgi:cobalt-precorrin-7 (C5)-methyltransferase
MINIIGLGPGNLDYITKLGEKIIYESDILIGGKRNLVSIQEFKGKKVDLSTNLEEVIDYIKLNKDKKISIIASGDPLIYGIGKYISENLEKKDINIINGISSIQYIFSKINIDMNDLYITSSHGKIPDFDYILSHSKVAMVTDNKIGPREIAREIINRNLKKTMVIGEDLSYIDEKITVASPTEVLKIDNFNMNVVVILDER